MKTLQKHNFSIFIKNRKMSKFDFYQNNNNFKNMKYDWACLFSLHVTTCHLPVKLTIHIFL